MLKKLFKDLLAFVDEQTVLEKDMGNFAFTPADTKPIQEADGSIRIVPVAVRALMGEDFKARLAARSQPVLIVNGSDDTRAIAKEPGFVAGMSRPPQIVHFESTGHGVSIRAPAKFAAMVNEFAAKVTTP